MGRDKRFLCWNREEILLDRAIRICAETLRVTARSVRIFGSVPGRESVPDVFPGQGPMGGVSNAIEKSMGAALLILPVDMPLLCIDVLSPLVEAVDRGLAPGFAYSEYELPCAIICDLAAREKATSSRSMRDFHARLGSLRMSLVSELEHHMLNVNTPNDYLISADTA